MPFDPRQHVFSNNASSRLSVALGIGDTTVSILGGDGAKFPLPATGEIFKLTITNLDTGEFEILHCTSRTGDQMVVERGQEGTTAKMFPIGAVVRHNITAQTLEWLQSIFEP